MAVHHITSHMCMHGIVFVCVYVPTHACKLSMVKGKMEGARVGQEWCGVGGWHIQVCLLYLDGKVMVALRSILRASILPEK